MSLRKVKLYGKLRQFGREFVLDVVSPAEAIRALCVMIPSFEKFMNKSKEMGITYAVFVGKKNIGEDELNLGGSKDIRIAPIIIGSKRGGLFQTIFGAVLMVASIWFPPLMAAGLAMVAGGVVQMLSPQPKGLKQREPTDNAPSYAFGGSVNTTAYGNPIGVLAGERVIGGAIISAGVYAENL